MYWTVPQPITLFVGDQRKELINDVDAYAYFNNTSNNSPSSERWGDGYNPDEKVPASEWNWTFGQMTRLMFRMRKDVYSSCNEIMNLILDKIPGSTFSNEDDVDPTKNNRNRQLLQAVDRAIYDDRKIIAGSQATTNPDTYQSPLGSVATSSGSGKVSVNPNTGEMTANGLGNIAGAIPSMPSNVQTALASDKSAAGFMRAIFNLMYPVGTIYTSATMSTAAQVQAAFGGTWQPYGQGRVLVGAGSGTDAGGVQRSFTAGATGGRYSVILTSAQLAAHEHTGTSASAGAHTHTVTISSGGSHSHHFTTGSAGSHAHSVGTYRITGTYTATQLTYDGGGVHADGAFYDAGYGSNAGTEDARGSSRTIGFDAHGSEYVGQVANGRNSFTGNSGNAGAHTHVGNTDNDGAHTHTGSTSNNGAHTHALTVNDTNQTRGGAHENTQPYVVVYMYRRTA